MKVKNDAMQRKLWQPSPVVEQFKVRTKVKQVANDAGDSLWESTNGIKLLKLLWKCGRATGQTNTDYVCWTYRYKQSPDSYSWNVGGALGLNSDVVDTVLDSLHQSRGNTATGTVLTWNIPPQYARANDRRYAEQPRLGLAQLLEQSERAAQRRRDHLLFVGRKRYRQSSANSSAAFDFRRIAVRRRGEIVGSGLIGD